MIEGWLELRHPADYPAWRSSAASNICGPAAWNVIGLRKVSQHHVTPAVFLGMYCSSVSLVARLMGSIVYLTVQTIDKFNLVRDCRRGSFSRINHLDVDEFLSRKTRF